MGIHIIIVLNVVFVIGGRHKDGIQIEHIHAQLFQVIQFAHDARQITAVKGAHVHGLRPCIPVLHLFGVASDVGVLPIQHVVGRVAVAETIHENLIHDCALGPGRGDKARQNDKAAAHLIRRKQCLLRRTAGHNTFHVA